ncbi:sensor histidine kinase N-terminal domain-containing protein [Brevundimonas sp. BR2-1]|uniref:ATP-binding protein n=1 Tax=unclassified Brevundimonas TaxID=2622653 RepID=UPI0025BE2163|nr:ATP-binding protein [Brevundimonas sp. UBA7664]
MRSIRVRLFVILALVTAVVWGTSAVWIQVRTQAEIHRVLDRRLMESARMVSSLLDQGDLAAGAGAARVAAAPATTAGPGYERQLSCQIWSLRGELVSRSDGAPLERLAVADGFSERTIGDERWRVYTVHNRLAGVQVMVGDRLAMREGIVGSIITSLAAPTLVGLAALGLLIWWSVGRGLRPMRQLADTLGARRVQDLSPLTTPGGVEELRPMLDALNGLIDRLAAARRRQAEFTAAAAHELRTPLAGLRVQAQVAANATDPETQARALQHIVASVDRTSSLVSRLLEMARADDAAEPALVRRWTPLAQLVRTDIMGCRVRVEVSEAASAMELNVDPDRVSALFGNVLSNACAHARSLVRIDLDDTGPSPTLTIDDDGPGVPQADLTKLGRRFYRGPDAKPGGSGLGLSIVEATATAHSLTVVYGPSPLGGLRVTLAFVSPDTIRTKTENKV